MAGQAAQAETTYTWRCANPHQGVKLPGGKIRFWEEGVTDEGKVLGVYRTSDPAVADALRAAIARGGIPAWEEDEEEREANAVIERKRRQAVARVAKAAQAKAPAKGDE